MRRSLTTVAAALFCAASIAAVTTPANAATAARPDGIVTWLWGYFADLPTCHHEGAILGAEHPDWIGYYCQVDPTRPATNVGLWYEVVG